MRPGDLLLNAGLAAVAWTPSLSQSNPVFTMKGNSDSGGTTQINYVELPVLARVEAPAFGRVKPFVYGGPGFAHRTSCALEGSQFSMTCDSATVIWRRASPGVYYSRTDVDGIIGGGLAVDVVGRTMTVGLRDDVGFVKFLSDGDMKTRVLSFLGTVEAVSVPVARGVFEVDGRTAQRDNDGMNNNASTRFAVALVLILGFALAAAIGSTYFGHASSPYGVCYGTSGRTIPCTVAHGRAS